MAKHRLKPGRTKVADLAVLMACDDYTRSLERLDSSVTRLGDVLDRVKGVRHAR